MTSSVSMLLAADTSDDSIPEEWAEAPREWPAQPGDTALARILVVDDEPIVLSFVARLLQEAGYEVQAAASGAEALRVAMGDWREFDLLITDVRMPSLDGWELGRLLRERRPALPVLYVSGYDVMGSASVGVAFLRKPFEPTELLRHVAGLLQGR